MRSASRRASGSSGRTQSVQARRDAGRVPLSVWLTSEESEALAELVAETCASKRDAVARAIVEASERASERADE